jgi:hypothetical protein
LRHPFASADRLLLFSLETTFGERFSFVLDRHDRPIRQNRFVKL